MGLCLFCSKPRKKQHHLPSNIFVCLGPPQFVSRSYGRAALPLDAVEPASEIVKRFRTGPGDSMHLLFFFVTKQDRNMM